MQLVKIDLIASLPHYASHLLPIFQALPDDLRGEVHPPREPVQPPRAGGRAALVASWQDLKELRNQCPIIYVEHGAGQSYGGDPRSAWQPGYSASGGGRHGETVIGYISPNQTIADRWSKPAVAVGCPKLDRWVGVKPHIEHSICFVWHWDCVISPEAATAFWHYAGLLPQIVDRFEQQGFSVFGHAHPRWEGELHAPMVDAGMRVLATEAEVFAMCGMLAVDNSSLGAEFMALGRPIIWLNQPGYRYDIDHGGRFWDWTRGVTTIDTPEQLLRHNLWDEEWGDWHRHHADTVYTYRDGRSSERAAAFIDGLIRER